MDDWSAMVARRHNCWNINIVVPDPTAKVTPFFLILLEGQNNYSVNLKTIGRPLETNSKVHNGWNINIAATAHGQGYPNRVVEAIPHICHRHHIQRPCEQILSGLKFSRLGIERRIFCNFRGIYLGIFCIILVNNLGSQKAARVKEITNMKYG